MLDRGSAGDSTGAVALGFTVMIDAPSVALEVTTYDPAKADWVATPSASTSVASVMSPEPSRTAARAAISLPSAVLVTRIAAGELTAATATSASTLGATRKSASSAPSTA